MTNFLKTHKLPLLLVLVTLLASLSLAAARNYDTVRLEVINKSGMRVTVSMSGKEEDESYYLTIPAGDRKRPSVTTFAIVRDEYSASVFYVEYYDVVYGYRCSSSSTQVDLTHNNRLLVKECTWMNAAASGEKRKTNKVREMDKEDLTKYEQTQAGN